MIHFIICNKPDQELLKICEDYNVPHDPMRKRDEKFYWAYLRGVKWPNNYIGSDSMACWIIEGSQGFTDCLGFQKCEKLCLFRVSSKASARSRMMGNTESALTAQRAFLKNF